MDTFNQGIIGKIAVSVMMRGLKPDTKLDFIVRVSNFPALYELHLLLFRHQQI